MNKKNKVIILASIIIGVLVLALGLTYAAITFDETKGNSKLVLGDIWMHYNESDTSINITDLMPSENYTNDYFEFTIDGKNTYDKKDIWYEIVLSHGEYTGDDENRTIRIDDQLLKFKLVEVVDGEEVEIFGNRTYSDLTNKRIHVDTISSTDNNYSKTYRLYMRLAEYTSICMGDADGCDYYINPSSEYANLDWDKLFASIKVNVSGDFEEKSIETPGSCFTYEVTSIENPTVNSVMVSQEVVDNELSRCVNYLISLDWGTPDDGGFENYCRGTGTWAGYTFQEDIEDNIYDDNELLEMLNLNIIQSNDDSTYTVNPIMANQEYENEFMRCVDYFSNNSDFVLSEGEDWESFCKGTGTLNGNTFQTSIDDGLLENYVYELASLNVITGTSGTIELRSYNDSCGPDVVIPREINGFSIKKISTNIEDCRELYDADSYFEDANIKNIIIQDNVTEICASAFEGVGLETVELPDSISAIYDAAFWNNNLLSVKIPNNVTTIGAYAFRDNQLTSVEIPNNVTTIGTFAFLNNQLTNVEIPNSVTTIYEYAFNKNQLTNLRFEENSVLTTIGSSAFRDNQLTSIEIPDSVTTIESEAFRDNQLTSVEIPDSVTTIDWRAFYNNQLETVTIGSGIHYIYSEVFASSSTSNPNLESITFTSKTCEEIKNIVASSSSTSKYFPWLSSSSPYYLEGYKASIIGTDGECVY